MLTFLMVAWVSNESRASTSVETRPGMRARICFPNSTSCNEERKGSKGQLEPSGLNGRGRESGVGRTIRSVACST